MASTENTTSAGRLFAQQDVMVGPSFGNVQSLIGNTTKQSAFSTASDTFVDIHQLELRVESIVSRLVGPRPGKDDCGPCAPSLGILDDLDSRARSAAAAIRRIDDALNRLERELP